VSSIAELTIANFRVHWNSYLDDLMTAPFQAADRASDGKYKASAAVVARRLDLLGHSLKAARRAYECACDRLGDYSRERWPGELLGPGGFDRWLDAVRTCIDAARKDGRPQASDVAEPLLRFVLEDDDEHFLGFPGGAWLLVARAVAHVAPDDEFVLDIEELVDTGYLDEDEDLNSEASREPVIIVTEGKSDSRLLRRSVSALFPEFAEFMSFIDFETANAKGGTDELLQFGCMLIGCGIRNRMVFLFDNNTAGSAAHDRFVELKAPHNVFVMKLPQLRLIDAYPTLGPEGEMTADINGRACALELYLGLDALTDESGELIPIRWTGFDDKRKQYQGQITQKDAVQKRFEEKLARVERDPGERGELDFSGIELIVSALFDNLRQR